MYMIYSLVFRRLVAERPDIVVLPPAYFLYLEDWGEDGVANWAVHKALGNPQTSMVLGIVHLRRWANGSKLSASIVLIPWHQIGARLLETDMLTHVTIAL